MRDHSEAASALTAGRRGASELARRLPLGRAEARAPREGERVPERSDPVLNGPYDPPERYFQIGPHGPTGEVLPGRRPSESFVAIATARKGTGEQESLDFDLTGERRELNSLINDLRRDVERWRVRDYPRVTPTSRKLLTHWADPTREDRVLFCQREAAETAVFLAEVAGRDGYTD
jgi:type III restriction enzyme